MQRVAPAAELTRAGPKHVGGATGRTPHLDKRTGSFSTERGGERRERGGGVGGGGKEGWGSVQWS